MLARRHVRQSRCSLLWPKQERLRSTPPELAPMAAPSTTAPAAPSSAAAAPVPPDSVEAAPSEASARTRSARPRIDLDESIAQARQAMKTAQKEVAQARREARNERRKKQRLIKKAANLIPEDLERIAMLKRCGLAERVQPGVQEACTPHENPAASSAGLPSMPASALPTGTVAAARSGEPPSPTDRASDAEGDRS